MAKIKRSPQQETKTIPTFLDLIALKWYKYTYVYNKTIHSVANAIMYVLQWNWYTDLLLLNTFTILLVLGWSPLEVGFGQRKDTGLVRRQTNSRPWQIHIMHEDLDIIVNPEAINFFLLSQGRISTNINVKYNVYNKGNMWIWDDCSAWMLNNNDWL